VRRAAVISLLAAAVLAGCGGGEETAPTAETVDTTATQTETDETETGDTETGETETTETEDGAGSGGAVEGDPDAGEQVFAANGCGSCHTFAPAGSTGTTGPDLDELSDLAENANQPLAEFTREAIVEPNAYVEEGFPEGVMPAYDQLGEKELNDLVAFLVQS
jgi:mono/diheme cytochrome c family protein